MTREDIINSIKNCESFIRIYEENIARDREKLRLEKERLGLFKGLLEKESDQ